MQSRLSSLNTNVAALGLRSRPTLEGLRSAGRGTPERRLLANGETIPSALVTRLVRDGAIDLFSLTESEQRRRRTTVDYAKRHHLVPEGHRIETSSFGSTGTLTIRLTTAIRTGRKRNLDLPPVIVSEQLDDLHPVAARLRDSPERLTVLAGARERCLRILQAIAAAAVAGDGRSPNIRSISTVPSPTWCEPPAIGSAPCESVSRVTPLPSPSTRSIRCLQTRSRPQSGWAQNFGGYSAEDGRDTAGRNGSWLDDAIPCPGVFAVQRLATAHSNIRVKVEGLALKKPR
ncbi:hypothetical protein [Glycomyces niveus]|uniref:DUF222 domain-containing protein n=1 Tax=Glycomyces niveus TaxID=2820287 RepID=A0ABS3U9T8_9ACTN|nr:hypothetical protein [Glycomyces sp. NEAU-S30]MBO3735538.1 hypothetical protein [Glycomyces sp. NEAU-S30]